MRQRSEEERFSRRVMAGGIVVWSIAAVVALTFWGAVIWGIVTLVKHFT